MKLFSTNYLFALWWCSFLIIYQIIKIKSDSSSGSILKIKRKYFLPHFCTWYRRNSYKSWRWIYQRRWTPTSECSQHGQKPMQSGFKSMFTLLCSDIWWIYPAPSRTKWFPVLRILYRVSVLPPHTALVRTTYLTTDI